MRFVAVAVDYDGTLAEHGTVGQDTLAAIEDFLASGRTFILVTGRILSDLLTVFPKAGLCTSIVAENGAVLYHPSTHRRRLLGAPAPPAFVDSLAQKQVPLTVGDSIIATVRPHEVAVLETIRDLGLEHHVIFNREAVMVLPSGINKATGLQTALRELGLSARNVVAIGDSENDHALLAAGECAVAVRNAIPRLQAEAHIVTQGESGAGVSEILRALVRDDLDSLHAPADIPMGRVNRQETWTVPSVRDTLLVTGTRPAFFLGKLIGRLRLSGYQCCVMDPTGHYAVPEGAVSFGDAVLGPTIDEVMTAMANPETSLLINVCALPQDARRAFADELLARLHRWQQKAGRPHRIVIVDADQLFPPDGPSPRHANEGVVYGVMAPERLAETLLRTIRVAISVGPSASEALYTYARAAGMKWPSWTGPETGPDEGVAWRVGEAPIRFQVAGDDDEAPSPTGR